MMGTMNIRTIEQAVRLETDRDRPSLTVLYVDDRPSSANDEDPTYLAFAYMEHMRELVRVRHSPKSRIRALHIGGAACTLARALDAEYPNSRQLAIEPDAALADNVRTWFDLPRSPLLKIRVADGRQTLEGQGGRGWDVILRDAFYEGRVPDSLRTLEAAQAAKAALAPAGSYIVNSPAADKADLAAISATFEHVIAIASPAVISGKHKGNITIGASAVPWPDVTSRVAKLRELARAWAPTPSAAPERDPQEEA